jgi:hypothetical protein
MTNKSLKVDALHLRSGTWIARPRGALGNVGWYPFPWTATTASSKQNAINKFKYEHAEQIKQWETATSENRRGTPTTGEQQ